MNGIKNFLKKFTFARKLNAAIKKPFIVNNMKKNGYIILEEAFSILEENQYFHFADFGTLLGFVRDNGFISHDTDTDIGILEDNRERREQLKDYFLAKNFKITHEFYLDNFIEEYSVEKNGFKIDLVYYTSAEDNTMFCYSFHRDMNKKYTDTFETDLNRYTYKKVTSLTTLNINGHNFKVPSNYSECLEERYVKTWNIKDKNWHYSKDPHMQEMPQKGYMINHKRKNY